MAADRPSSDLRKQPSANARAIATSIVAAVAWTAGTIIPASAETINVYDDHGGSVAEYDAHWSGLAARGVNVRIVGPCQSACTVLLAHIPNDRICVTPQASFGSHLAHRPEATARLWAGYNAGIRQWIDSRGGLSADFKWMRVPDIYRFFRKC
jgi:hypothetical protein